MLHLFIYFTSNPSKMKPGNRQSVRLKRQPKDSVHYFPLIYILNILVSILSIQGQMCPFQGNASHCMIFLQVLNKKPEKTTPLERCINETFSLSSRVST